MSKKRVFLLVIDSFGIGELPDAKKFGDEGSNTLLSCYKAFLKDQGEDSQNIGAPFFLPNLRKLGLFNIDGVNLNQECDNVHSAYGRFSEKSNGPYSLT